MSEYKLPKNCYMTIPEIVASYNEAKDKKAQIGIIADLCGTSEAEILNILCGEGCVDENGNPPRLPGITAEDIPDILKMRAEGMSYDEIGKIYGVSRITVQKRLKNYKSQSEAVPESNSGGADSAQMMRDRDYAMSEMFFKEIHFIYELICGLCERYPGLYINSMVICGKVLTDASCGDIAVRYERGIPCGESDVEPT